MRKLINYIKSCFCDHDWELLSNDQVYKEHYNYNEPRYPIGYQWVYRCKKCGYFKKYKSY